VWNDTRVFGGSQGERGDFNKILILGEEEKLINADERRECKKASIMINNRR
jgi:hypothetical protein